MTDSSTTYLGLDLGTSGLRALLIDGDGRRVSSAEASYGSEHPHAGWSEQDPAEWIAACKSVFTQLVANNPDTMANLCAIGTAGHMHGATLLDATGAVLRPCILWNDTRSHAEATTLDNDPQFRDISGNIVFAGFTAPKLAWVKNNEPVVFDKISTVLLPKDYLTYWLTGQLVSEMSDASGTSWLDVKNRDWSPDLVTHAGMQLAQMPKLLEGTDSVAKIRPERADILGIHSDVTVVAGAADNAAAACGIGVLSDGHGFVSLGTSGVLLAGQSACTPLPASAVHTFCHAVPNTWYQMGVILSATDSLNWLARILNSTPEALTNELPKQLRRPSALMFVPYLSGERTPHNDSAVRGAFVGLDVTTSRSDMVQAVLEGVAFALRENLDALAKTGTDLSSIFAIGGGAKSHYWLEILATILDLELKLPKGAEFGAALGAARLAICGANDSPVETVMTPPEVDQTIRPNTALRPAFEAAYVKYKTLYPALQRHSQ